MDEDQIFFEEPEFSSDLLHDGCQIAIGIGVGSVGFWMLLLSSGAFWWLMLLVLGASVGCVIRMLFQVFGLSIDLRGQRHDDDI